MSKIWHIHEGFYIEQVNRHILAVIYKPDDQCVSFSADMIDDMIDALKSARTHFDHLELAELETKKMARWGRERTPALD